jgi:2-hydroxy-3-oxopropionate reductase
MIANLVGAGFEVRAVAHSERSRERLRGAGATEVATAAEVADGAGIVITMLPDSPDVLGVLFEEGLADALPRGSVLVDMSTIRPDAARRIAAELAERGVAALDAPVSGGEAGAIEGTLSIMVGGDAEALETARPVLAVLGATITHVGPAGAGQATKAANQLVVAANIQAVAEAIVLLQAADVDLAPALDALAGGLAGSTVLDRKRGNFMSGSFAPGFRLRLHDKDLGIVQASARELGLALPLTAVVSQLVTALVARGDGDLDHSALLALVRDLNGRPGEAA